MSLARVAEVEFQVERLRDEMEAIKKSLTLAVEMIRGNGDPTKGLVWVVADLSRLLATNTQMLEANRLLVTEHVKAEEERWARHIEVAHQERRSEFWEKVKDAAVKQTVTGTIIAVLALLVLGIVTFVRNGGHL